ncbi:MAG TPA: alpha/beta fold hydrolase [Kofleriaceae bacterium]|nr:alpha/beta fold hydrolase [Kofleriaceae bacterium]
MTAPAPPEREPAAHVERLVLDTPRGRFEALAAGPTDAPPVIVLHGFPDAPPTFASLLAALARRGHRAVAPWLRGYAPSIVDGPYDVETLADDVAAWADVLSPDAPVRLVGHDWGAIATYAACSRHRARVAAAVTLAVPHPLAFLRALDAAQVVRSWYMLFFQLPGAPRLARARDFALVDRLWRRWSPRHRLPPALRAELHACLAASWPAPLLYYRALLRPFGPAVARVRRDSPAATPSTVPTLYLHGADDGCIGVDAERDADRYFAGPYRFEVLAGAGHFLAAERPEDVAARADAWFRAHGGG